jgi:hypothetical protein
MLPSGSFDSIRWAREAGTAGVSGMVKEKEDAIIKLEAG